MYIFFAFIDQSVTTYSFICSSQDELTSLIRHESDVWRGFIQRHADMVSKAACADPLKCALKTVEDATSFHFHIVWYLNLREEWFRNDGLFITKASR